MAQLADVNDPAQTAGGVPVLRDKRRMSLVAPGLTDGVERVRRALVLLRDPTSSDHLAAAVPGAVLTLGFDRAVYGTVRGLAWTAVAAASRAPEIAVPGGVERTVTAAHAEHVVLVDRVVSVVDGYGACQERLLPGTWCASYIVAPVIHRGEVVGFVHAGRRNGHSSAHDREVLGTFAEALGLGFAAARATDDIRSLLARMSAVAGEWDRQVRRPTGPILPPDASLTEREQEVLHQLAAGQTNAQIARRLVITEGTVKSHVKRIMKKLGAANRAEAVAEWMRRSASAGRI